jgi:glucose-6-phosphate isomerase
LLSTWGKRVPPLGNHSVDNAIALFDNAESASQLITDFIQEIDKDGYLAIMAYVDRQTDHRLIELRNIIASKFQKSVTFGWGPRFLHSTGQFHKGGQPNGSFLQLTAQSDKDYEVPGEDFTFKSLCMAQAIGDYKTLSGRGLKTLRLHLMEREAGIKQFLEIAEKL